MENLINKRSGIKVTSNVSFDEENQRELVESALAQVNGKATSFTVTKFTTVKNITTRLEELLEDSGLAVSERRGAVATYVPAGPAAKSYKYSCKTTELTLGRFVDGWRLVKIQSRSLYPGTREKLNLKISQKQADIIQAKSIRKFTVLVK